jgi:peptidoglycan/xylan/chitin deacetylase (PgdA/CDA1 family)
MILGLRIDVCTYEGLRAGVPNLLPLLERFGVRASFFVALGPDRSGQAAFGALRAGFLAKMRRTQAVRTYGWRTMFSGTLLPARRAADLANVLRAIPAAGHELAVHGYDHRRWQDRLNRMREPEIRREMTEAVRLYERVTGHRPHGFGSPGWQCGPISLRLVDELGFAYASDTRGRHPFYPSLGGVRLRTLQLPTTLPTLDEVLGLEGLDGTGFLALVGRELGRDPWPVLTLHAEMEGGRFLWVAEALLAHCAARGVRCLPLVALTTAVRVAGEDRIPKAEIACRPIRGRAGRVAMPVGLEPQS